MWTPKTLTLVWAIQSDRQEQITELTFKSINHADHTKALKEGGDKERVVLEKLATFSCGLSADEFTRLALPDHNSIKRILSDYVSLSTAEIYKQTEKEFIPNTPALLVPITGDNGNLIDVIELKIPTVKCQTSWSHCQKPIVMITSLRMSRV